MLFIVSSVHLHWLPIVQPVLLLSPFQTVDVIAGHCHRISIMCILALFLGCLCLTHGKYKQVVSIFWVLLMFRCTLICFRLQTGAFTAPPTHFHWSSNLQSITPTRPSFDPLLPPFPTCMQRVWILTPTITTFWQPLLDLTCVMSNPPKIHVLELLLLTHGSRNVPLICHTPCAYHTSHKSSHLTPHKTPIVLFFLFHPTPPHQILQYHTHS